MALRWTAAAFEAVAENFRKIMGHDQLWILKAALDELTTAANSTNPNLLSRPPKPANVSPNSAPRRSNLPRRPGHHQTSSGSRIRKTACEERTPGRLP